MISGINKYLYLCLAAVTAAACNSKTQDVTENNTPQEISVRVTLPAVPSVDVKSVGPGPEPAWSEGDRLQIGDRIFELESFEGKEAVFTGIAPEGEVFDIHFPPLPDGIPEEGEIVQKADGDFSHIEYRASLKGVDSYEDIEFSHGWASEHGGVFSQTGYMEFSLNLPDEVEGIKTLVFLFGAGQQAVLNIEDGTVTDHAFTAWLPCDGVEFDGGTQVAVTLNTLEGTAFEKTICPVAQTLPGGCVSRLVLSPSDWQKLVVGPGSKEDPYLVSNAEEFCSIGSKLSLGVFTYFKLTADIDLKDAAGISPVNLQGSAYGIMFDGCGHTIRNFSYSGSKWPSIFGFIYGEVKNLTVEDSSVSVSANTPAGLVAAYVGNIDCTLPGRLVNVHVVRGKVTSSVNSTMGGMVGRSAAGTIVGCSFDGTVTRTAASSYTATYYPVGGVLGEALENVTISGCSSSGTLTTAGGRACGGIIGKCDSTLDIDDCHSTMNITARDDVAGGIIGYYGNGTISSCSASSDISVTGKGSGYSYIGGIAGYSSGSVVMTDCTYGGNLKGYAGIVGGVFGECAASAGNGCIMQGCYSSGRIEATAIVGGLLARASNNGLQVKECGSSMEVAATGSYVGGLIADLPKNSVVSNCFASGAVKGVYAVGGLIGRAYGRQTSTGSLDTDVNTTVENCIAFNPSVSTVTSGGETPSNHYSGGAVIGCSSRPNTLRGCLRRADMVFNFYKDASLNVLFDHADSSPEDPLVQPAGSEKWFSPYHGKAAEEGATLPELSRSLGWSQDVSKL